MKKLFFLSAITHLGKNKKLCRRLFYLFLIISQGQSAAADTLTIYDCQRLAWDNYGSLKNKENYRKNLALQTRKLNAGYLPAFSLNGQFAYQSDVFEIPFSPPGMELEALPKEKYQATIDIQQSIYDGGFIGAQKTVETFQAEVNLQETEADRRHLTIRVNESYFTILLLQQANRIIENSLDLLTAKLESLKAGWEGGVVMESELLKIRAEILNAEKEALQNKHNLKKAKDILSILIGNPIDDAVLLVKPEVNEPGAPAYEEHPDMLVLTRNQRLLSARKSAIQARYMPKINAFGTAGYGYPNPYDFYDINFSPFYIAGVKLQWKLWDWKQASAEQQTLGIQEDILENRKDDLRKNIAIKLENHLTDIAQYEELVFRDEKIADTRGRIRELSSRQLDEGIITSTEYLESVNAERSAKLNLERSRIELIRAKVSYLMEAGKP